MSKLGRWLDDNSLEVIRRFGLGIVYVLVISFAAFEITAMVFVGLFWQTPTTTFHGNTTDLQLARFKNSRYTECSTAIPKNRVDCSLVAKLPKEGWYLQQSSIPISNPYGRGVEPRRVNLEWCDTIASCFSNYTVVPSVPQESALAQVRLPRWTLVNLTMILVLIGALFMLQDSKNDNLMNDYDLTPNNEDADYGNGQPVLLHNPKHCHGDKMFSKIVFWIGNIWTTASFGLWWFEFVKEPALVSVVGFFGTWQLAHATHFHPLKCLLDKWVGRSIAARYIIQGILYAAAVVQCIATYTMLKGAGESSHPRYTCLNSLVQPTATCSTTELCAKKHLFADPGYGLYGDLLSTFNGFALVAWISTGARIVYKLLALKYKDMDESRFMWAMPSLMALLGFIVVGIIDVVDSMKSIIAMTHGTKEATVAFDMACGAVHVALSPWKQFFDVEIDGSRSSKVMRVVKMWLNA
ncbi:hypothetical protein CC80DRAFT_493892 [Byssothecium circinans]|uniref:Uncharacterized protein n=1 Tax=Byssothecium circinans TaxID=147558 RepID=A0A6A5TRV2_9PLEO|nr:hypothetical protein CC80DRAFT_493892 [Byssothecium circinans]